MTSKHLKRKIFALGYNAEWNEEEITEGLYNGLKQLFLIMKSQQNILFAGMFREF
jgi:hypothetical protein